MSKVNNDDSPMDDGELYGDLAEKAVWRAAITT